MQRTGLLGSRRCSSQVKRQHTICWRISAGSGGSSTMWGLFRTLLWELYTFVSIQPASHCMSTIADTPYTLGSSMVIAGRKKTGGVVVASNQALPPPRANLNANSWRRGRAGKILITCWTCVTFFFVFFWTWFSISGRYRPGTATANAVYDSAVFRWLVGTIDDLSVSTIDLLTRSPEVLLR